MILTQAEARYLIAIYRIAETGSALVSTTSIAKFLKTSSASVTDMIQKLSLNKIVIYHKYQGVELSELGRSLAIKIIRKHLLWEVFLADILKLEWHVIHQIAEQLEHIQSDILIERLDRFLGYPSCSPHGVMIPNGEGKVRASDRILLTDMKIGHSGVVSAIKDDSLKMFQYIHKKDIHFGAKIMVVDKFDFDSSIDIVINNKAPINVSRQVADKIMVSLLSCSQQPCGL